MMSPEVEAALARAEDSERETKEWREQAGGGAHGAHRRGGFEG